MKKYLFPTMLLAVCYAASFAQTITTVAGDGLWYGLGDGKQATDACLYYPMAVAVDAAGNIYIADANNNRIRKVNTSGIMSTVAGTGIAGYSGDGGAATAATLSYPVSLALDNSGNLYIAEGDNNIIRRVTPAGIISTVAGGGSASLGDGGPATAATLSRPMSVALDGAGNIYIADEMNQRIRKVNTSGIITTIAGSGTLGYSGDNSPATNAELYYPEGVAADGVGNVYIADTYNRRLRKVSTAGIITTIAGDGTSAHTGDGGPATAAEISGVFGIAIDNTGNIFFADANNNCIRKIDAAGFISTLAGNGTMGYSGDGGPATAAEISSINVAVDTHGNVYTADAFFAGTVRKINAADIISTVAGNGRYIFNDDNGPATSAEIGSPTGIAVADNGDMYIADTYYNRIRKVSGGIITTICGSDSEGYAGDGHAASAALMDKPTDVATDHKGNIFIADKINNMVRRIDASGIITTYAGNGYQAGSGIFGGFSGDYGPATAAELYLPAGIALDNIGNLYIADSWNERIRKVDTSGIITTIAGNGHYGLAGDGGRAVLATLNSPEGVCTDDAGNVYIADTYNSRIRKIDTAGIIATVAGFDTAGYSGDGGPATAARLYEPMGIKVNNGRLFIADRMNNRVRMVDASGTITTLAGTGTGSPSTGAYSGDGGPAAAAELYYPWNMIFDTAQNLYLTDQANYRVRKITFDRTIVHLLTHPAASVEIYPNPTTEHFAIRSSIAFPPGSVARLYDMSGHLLGAWPLTGKEAEISVARLAAGMYHCRIIMNGEVVTKKVVVVK